MSSEERLTGAVAAGAVVPGLIGLGGICADLVCKFGSALPVWGGLAAGAPLSIWFFGRYLDAVRTREMQQRCQDSRTRARKAELRDDAKIQDLLTELLDAVRNLGDLKPPKKSP